MSILFKRPIVDVMKEVSSFHATCFDWMYTTTLTLVCPVLVSVVQGSRSRSQPQCYHMSGQYASYQLGQVNMGVGSNYPVMEFILVSVSMVLSWDYGVCS